MAHLLHQHKDPDMEQYEPSMYIRLETEKLDKTNIKSWYNIVKKYAPSGTVTGIQVPDQEGNLKMSLLISRPGKTGYEYDIPLTRDLLDSELEPIVMAWAAIYPEKDFTISSTSADVEAKRQGPADTIDMDEKQYNDFCETLAKQEHIKWCADRQNNGWRYGLNYSRKDKTHPLLRPWEQLSDQEKDINYELPRTLVQELNDQGYVVVSRNELAKWLSDR